ncbi:hypothetical protein CFOL_v3_35562, partial [Cephalotus follicularis]
WNQDLIKQCFTNEVSKIILSIPLSHRQCKDKLIWSKASKGGYTVKTRYHVVYEWLKASSSWEPVSPQIVPVEFWKWLWGLKVSHKFRLFGWKGYRGILPTKTTLFKLVSQTNS